MLPPTLQFNLSTSMSTTRRDLGPNYGRERVFFKLHLPDLDEISIGFFRYLEHGTRKREEFKPRSSRLGSTRRYASFVESTHLESLKHHHVE